MLAAMNPDGRSNADVVPRWVNGQDVTGQPRNMWIVDFGVGTSEAEAALYEGLFEWFDVEATDPRIRSTPPNDGSPQPRAWSPSSVGTDLAFSLAGAKATRPLIPPCARPS